MTSIQLGARPKSFSRIVKFPLIDGTIGSLEVSYKYRTRIEFGQFVDALVAAAQAGHGQSQSQERITAEDFSMERIMAKTARANADYLLDVLDGWGLDVALTPDNVRALADQYPGATMAIMEAYRAAVTEGRLGN